MKYVYSKLIQENPTIYHVWYLYESIKEPGILPPSVIVTEISDKVSQLLIKDQISLIDTEDVYIILNNCVRITSVNKNRPGETGYLEIGIHGKVQNLIMQFDPKSDRTKTVDHINTNRLDNRRCNLRLSSLSTQMRNRKNKKQPISGHRGIVPHGRKFDVTFNYNNKRYRAYFYDLQDAINWRDTKMKEVIPEHELLEWRDLQTEAQ